MKTNRVNKLARLTGMTIALALFAGVACAQNGAKGGATKLLQLNDRLVTPKSEAGDHRSMSCGKCKESFVERVDWSARGANKPTTTVARHLCDGCATEWNVVGHGKAKVNVAEHKCTSCGAATLACCNTSKSGTAATKGMEKKFEVAPLK
jgi:hypothetical protein